MFMEILSTSKASFSGNQLQESDVQYKLTEKCIYPARDERDQSEIMRREFSAQSDEMAQNQTIHKVFMRCPDFNINCHLATSLIHKWGQNRIPRTKMGITSAPIRNKSAMEATTQIAILPKRLLTLSMSGSSMQFSNPRHQLIGDGPRYVVLCINK